MCKICRAASQPATLSTRSKPKWRRRSASISKALRKAACLSPHPLPSPSRSRHNAASRKENLFPLPPRRVARYLGRDNDGREIMAELHKNLINGEWEGTEGAENINPSNTNEVVGLY